MRFVMLALIALALGACHEIPQDAPKPYAGRRQGLWKERGKQGAPGHWRACEAPQFPVLLFSIRVLTQRVMTVAVS